MTGVGSVMGTMEDRDSIDRFVETWRDWRCAESTKKRVRPGRRSWPHRRQRFVVVVTTEGGGVVE